MVRRRQSSARNTSAPWTRFRGFKLFYGHADAMRAMCQQADAFEAFFTIGDDDALIVDCGANIGVTMLDWKSRWPQAKIICVEPDPHAFALLESNINENDLPGVRSIQAALSDRDGQAPFYGELSKSADARGNSLRPAWGRRQDTSCIEVECRRLSTIIGNQHVDFLKLDIEGNEQCVLQELQPKLSQIDAIYVEVHQTDEDLSHNSVSAIEQLLRDSGFVVEAESRDPSRSLPEHLASWQAAAGASQSQLLCWR